MPHLARLSQAAARRFSAASRSKLLMRFATQRAMKAASAARAQVSASIDLSSLPAAGRFASAPIAGAFSGVPSHKARAAGASASLGGVGRAHQKGSFLLVRHVLSFVPVQRVTQPDIRFFLSIEAPMEQLQLPGLLCRLDAPSIVSPEAVARCKTYREAVRLCWELRKVKNMTRRGLAERAGLYPPHVTCYLADDCRKRDLPAEKIPAVELACNNTAISQWLAMHAQLTVVEEMQAARRVG